MKLRKKIAIAVIITAGISIVFLKIQPPMKEFSRIPVYEGVNNFTYSVPVYDSSKKTVVVVANNDGTELFDMMAPFYLFNATEKANVYIVAKNKYPITTKKGIFLLPQSTFSEIDSIGIKPDVIVIPFLNVGDSLNQDPVIINWIKKHFSADVNILAICDGSATAAATGIYDGKQLTTHATDFPSIKSQFSKPIWVQNTGVIANGNLYSTAGVSNATEGSLIVINKLFGPDIMKKVMADISYPYPFPRTEHKSIAITFKNKISIFEKVLLNKNKNLGLYLSDGINEFELSGVMDTYNRSFPSSIESYSINDLPVRSKYGLTIIPTAQQNGSRLDELHVVSPVSFPATDQPGFKFGEIIKYDSERQYIIDKCLHRINNIYGKKFQTAVKLALDYN